MGRRALTPEQVRELRAWYSRRKETPSVKSMARKFGLDASNLMLAASRQTYKEVQ